MEKEPLKPAAIYDHIESWWGDKFDDELIERMVYAPMKHKLAFTKSVRPLWKELWKSSGARLRAIPRGVLRPALTASYENYSQQMTRAMRVLLYAHEIVLDKDHFFDFDPRIHNFVGCYRDSLEQMARMRPLVEDGSIKFATISSDVIDPSLGLDVDDIMELPEVAEWLEPNADSLPTQEGKKSFMRLLTSHSYGGISIACNLAAKHQAHMLAQDSSEQAVIRALLQRSEVDKSHAVLRQLAAVNVPAMIGDIDALIKLRQSEADFADWRTHLGEAMVYIEDLGGADWKSLDEASDSVYKHLMDGLSQVEKAVKKSPALQALKGGLQGLALTGLSAAATSVAYGGDPVKTVVGGGVGKLGDVVINYVKAVKARRKDHLIWDVAMMFDPSRGNS
jgi:hypothetical protein